MSPFLYNIQLPHCLLYRTHAMHYGNKYGAKYKHPIIEYQREYNSWYAMKERCMNFNNPKFVFYGARGIKICDRWADSFDNFVEDMGKRPEGTTIDRIDSKGNYEPSNCRWATYAQQTLNTSRTLWLNDENEKICLAYFAKKYGIPPTTIKHRINRGDSVDQLKVKPIEKLIYNIEYKGVVYGLRSICREFNLPATTFRRKRSQGMTVEQALVYVFKRKNIDTVESDFKVTTENYPYNWMND